MKVIIVDDDEVRRGRLVEYISTAIIDGIESVTVAGCVDEAKSYLKNVYYDVLILDVVLPKRYKGSATAENGLKLLGQISRSRILKKPAQVIGITAYEEDISKYREEFENSCAVVIEAKNNRSEWRSKIVEQLKYLLVSRVSRTTQHFSTSVVTVHGIQTFGEWQNRLKTLTDSQTDAVEFNSYKYGYFSAFSFFLPIVRNWEVNKLRVRLRSLFVSSESKHLVVFCHSFGTYLIAYALKSLQVDLARFDKVTLVMSGSVLRSEYSWDYVRGHSNIKIVNECGDNDFVLWVSRALVPGVGMAGKVGFYGFNSSWFMNRYYRGGHSLYFKGDGFMRKYWLPLILNEDYKICVVDERKPGFLLHGFADKVIDFLGGLKSYIYVGLSVGFLFFLLK